MNLSKKFKKVLLSVLSVFTFASAISITSTPTEVNASGLDVRASVNAYINVSSTGAHYSFNGGNNFDVVMTGSKEQLTQVGLDCTAGAVAVAAHAIMLAGGNPYDYFGMLNGVLNTVYPPALRSYFESSSKWTTVATGPVDASVLQPGDLLIYGTSGAGHMAIYAGGSEIFDFRSNGNGSNTYAGYANYSNYQPSMGTSSGGGSNELSGVYRAVMTRDISLTVKKTSSNTDVTNNNPNYSDLTATFGVYTDANCSNKIGTIKTDKDGNGSAKYTVDGGISTVYVKEESAPVNYSIASNNVQTVDVSSGSGNVTFANAPDVDPGFISLNKVDSEGKKVAADMVGAEFTFKYYAINPNSVNSAEDVANMTPTRTWVYKTVNVNGNYLAGTQIAGSLVENKSDAVYSIDGNAAIPYGVLTIQETAAVDSYTTDGGYFKTGSIQMDANGTMFFKVNSPNSIENMIAGNEITKKEDVYRGNVEIQKVDAETMSVKPQGDATFAGTTFDLYYVDHVTQPGKGITIKVDANENGTYDADEEFKPGDKIRSITLDSEGKWTCSDEYLEYGTYKLVETSAPAGYSKLDSKGSAREYEFSITEDGMTALTTVEETPLYGDVQLYKHYNAKDGSEVDDKAEANATFFIALKSKVDSEFNGDSDAAYKAFKSGSSALTKHEWTEITTNSKGIATATDLAMGTYILKQTGGDDETLFLNEDYVFQITADDIAKEDGTKPSAILLSVTNDYKPYIIEFDKYDSYTNQMISLTSASFKIKNNETGEYVVQEVGGKKYDTFKTHSTNEGTNPKSYYLIPDADDSDLGKAVTPLSLKSGTYTIEEVETPDNFVTIEPFEIKVNSNEISRVTEDGKYVKLVNVKNTPVTGKLVVNKTATLVDDADLQLIEDLDLSKIKFELRAAEDIINPDDGSVLVEKGGLATDLNHNVIGSFNVDKDGNATIDNIPLGKYTLKEVETLPGLALSEETTEVTFTAVDHNTPVVTETVELNNYETETHFSKVDVTGEQEIPGAHLVITDQNGDTVAEWDSTDKAYEIAGIPEGTYTLSETIAPEGFVKRTSTVEFTVKGHDVSTVTMENKTFDFTKVDAGGEEVEGAKMQVFELKDGEITGEAVDEWTSTTEVHHINNLEEGKSYRIHEDVAAEGYVKASDIDITVTSDYTANQEVSMIDKQMLITKTDVGGKEVPGATITVVDENDEVMDTWTSTTEEHPVSNLEVGKTYTLREDTAPLGYVKRTEITFTVLDDGLDQSFNLVDTIERASKLDADGNYVTGATMQAIDSEGNVVDTWKTGQHIVDISDENKAAIEALANGESAVWTLEDGTKVEVVAIVTSNEATKTDDEVDPDFSADEEPATKIDETEDIDSEFSVDETDETVDYDDEIMPLDDLSEDKAVVDGTDEDEEVTDDSISEIRTYAVILTDADGVVSTYDIDTNGNETSHRIQNLVEGETYTIKEVEAPKGYYFAQEQTLVAGEDESDHERNFVDRSVKYLIEKVDENGAPVKGVTLKLTDVTVDEDGKLVNTDENGQPAEIELPNGGVTTGEPFELNGVLEAEHNYRLEETEWTNGVYKATDIYFNVDKYGDPTNPVITITMIDSLAKVTVNKIDSAGNPLAGAKMQIIEAELATDKSATTENEATKDATKVDDDAYLVDEETDEVANYDDEIMPLNETSEEKAVVDETDEVSEEEVTDKEATKQDVTDSIDEEYTISDSELKYVPVKDADGNDKVVYEFTTTDDASGIDISDYVKGDKTYILREVEAPYGYNTIKDEVFTVTGRSDSYQVIYAIDTPKQYGVEITKTNEAGTKKLANAEFGLFSTKTGKLVRDVDGNVCQGKTDSNGKLTFNVSYNGSQEGYYIMEINAPTGYQKDTTHHVVKLADDYTFVNAMKYTITNKESGHAPGVSAPVIAIVGGCVVLVGIVYLLVSKKKKSEGENKEAK